MPQVSFEPKIRPAKYITFSRSRPFLSADDNGHFNRTGFAPRPHDEKKMMMMMMMMTTTTTTTTITTTPRTRALLANSHSASQ
jgi:hypothetical protein